MSKNTKYIIALAALLIVSVANATVRTVNNNNPSPGQYISWPSVEAASSIGDTIYVSGTTIGYGDINVSKANLTIIGTGYNPQKQNPIISEFRDIITTGSVGQIRIDGIKCRNLIVAPTFGSVSISAFNSYIIEEIYATPSNTFDCYLYLQNNILGTSLASERCLNIITDGALRGLISNNILKGTFRVLTSGSTTGFIIDCNITNNTFVRSTNYVLFSNTQFSNSLFSNNIILGYNLHFLFSSSSVICENNIIYPYSFSTPLPNSTGTISANPLLVNYPCPGWGCEFNTTYDYHLSASSPGKNAGTDGTDIGPYGGPYGATFTTYGEPHIPQMKQMNMPATVVSGNTFNVNVISTVK